MGKLSFLGATVLAIAVSTSASAGEAGKMYGRVDLGYSINQDKINLGQAEGKSLKGFTGDVGVGYNISEELRTDVTFGFTPALKHKKGAEKVKFEEKSLSMLLNVYYDFNNNSGVTPYLMAGAGLGRSRYSVQEAEASQKTKSKSKNKAVFQVGTGVAVEITKGMLFDVGYKVSGTPKSTTKVNGNTEQDQVKNKFSHKFTAGVRVTF